LAKLTLRQSITNIFITNRKAARSARL